MDDYTDLTARVIGACFEIHRKLGPGFPEKVYASSLKIAFNNAKIPFETESAFSVKFDEKIVGKFRADFVIETKVILEIKAVENKMPKIFGAQLVSYLKASGLRVGLLVNFGSLSCEIKRFKV